MKLTVIPEDNTIVVDGDVRYPTNLVYPDDVRAIQWNGDAGAIEYPNRPQEHFNDPAVVEPYVVAHAAALSMAKPEPTFPEARAREYSKFKADREAFNSRMTTVAFRFMWLKTTEGDLAVVNALSIIEDLRTMLTHTSIVDAANITDLRQAMKAQYNATIATARADVYAAFRSFDA